MSDWNQFFESLRKYLDYFRVHAHVVPALSGINPSVGPQTISESELAGLLSWIRIATVISKEDKQSRRHMYEERTWNCVETMVGLLACPIPLVLKQSIYEFLGALAIDEVAAVNIWNCLLCEGICVQQQGGKLTGIQQDLDDQETQLKVYNCTQGFLTLMKELFSHKTRPGTQQVAPYLQFIVHSILCQFSTRSYSDLNQMWKLVKLALDSLYEPLKTFYATPTIIQNKSTEVQILAQLLSDSPLSRSLLQIIIEGADQLQEDTPFNATRDDATFSAIRLLYAAIAHRAAMADAIRAVNSDIMVVSVESVLFSAVPHPRRANLNYLSILLQYASEFEQLSRHTFYVWQIVKEATAQRPSLQTSIIQAILPRRAQLISAVANLSAVFSAENMEIGLTDLLPSDIESLSPDRLRGEICRLMFELFNDAMESDPGEPNVVFALMNFDLSEVKATTLDIPSSSGEGLTCLHNLIEIAEQMAFSTSPFEIQFAGLYEPALRLIMRLCSIRASISPVLTRFLRSHYDLIYRLANSPIFRCSELPRHQSSAAVNDSAISLPRRNATTFPSILTSGDNEETTSIVAHKSLQGIILELVALEMSALIRTGHIEQPQRFLRILLEAEMAQQQSLQGSSALSVGAEQRALLWSLLESSRVFAEEVTMPNCLKFETQKVSELLNLCIRKNAYNIDQYDVLYLHLLLNSEINCIMNTEIGQIKMEARAILDFCMRRNSRNLLEGACVHLLSGWLSVVSVLALHAPLPFIESRTHQWLLVDSLFLLKDYCRCVEMSAELAASVAACIFRIVRAICGLFINSGARNPQNSYYLRESLFPILHLLLQCIVLPGYSKSVAFKSELYSSCLRVLDLCSPAESSAAENGGQQNGSPKSEGSGDILSVLLLAKVGHDEFRINEKKSVDDPLVALVNQRKNLNEFWKELFDPIVHEIVQTICSDIMFAPLSLKILATAMFGDVLREDARNGGRMAREFAYSGALQCVKDTLARLEHSIGQMDRPEPQTGIKMTGNDRSSRSIVLADALKMLISMAQFCTRNTIVGS